MILHHGSNVAVENPQIIVSNRALDFGAGFYTTSSEKQAARWARLQVRRRKAGIPTITSFDFDQSAVDKLACLRFNKADAAWLRYVAQNRKNAYRGPKYDLVVGPVANDITMAVIGDYMAGSIDEQTAIVLLESQKLVDQYAFLTWKGLSALTCRKVNEL